MRFLLYFSPEITTTSLPLFMLFADLKYSSSSWSFPFMSILLYLNSFCLSLLVVYHCTRNYYPKTWWLERIFICSFCSSRNQTWLFWVLCFRLFYRLQLRITGTVVSSRERLHIQVLSVVVHRIQFFIGCWLDSLTSSVFVGQMPLSVLWHHEYLQNGSYCSFLFNQTAQTEKKKREYQQDQSRSLVILSKPVKFHHFVLCCLQVTSPSSHSGKGCVY